MPLHSYQYHVMCKESTMAPLHFLGQGDENETQHDYWSCDATDIGGGIT